MPYLAQLKVLQSDWCKHVLMCLPDVVAAWPCDSCTGSAMRKLSITSGLDARFRLHDISPGFSRQAMLEVSTFC